MYVICSNIHFYCEVQGLAVVVACLALTSTISKRKMPKVLKMILYLEKSQCPIKTRNILEHFSVIGYRFIQRALCKNYLTQIPQLIGINERQILICEGHDFATFVKS